MNETNSNSFNNERKDFSPHRSCAREVDFEAHAKQPEGESQPQNWTKSENAVSTMIIQSDQ